MNITYVVNVFPKLSETFVLDQITYLIDRGHSVNVIAASDWDEPDCHEEIEQYNLRAKTTHVAKSSDPLGFKMDERLIGTVLFTDIFHAHFANWPAQTAMKLSKLTEIPFVFTSHAYDIFADPDVNRLRSLAEGCSKLITISEYNKEYLIELLGEECREKIEIIRYGINIDRLQPVDRPHSERVKFLLCGRFVEKKGIVYAIRAFAEICTEANVELRIIGDGPLANEISREVAALGISDKVLLLGAQPRAAVFGEMKQADIFLLPSVTASDGDREGLPVSILEAQAFGIPILSTFHSGIPEGVKDGVSGILVHERDVDGLSKAMRQLISDTNLRNRLGKGGREIVCAKFSAETEFSRVEELLLQTGASKSMAEDWPQAIEDRTLARLDPLLKALRSQVSYERTNQSLKIENLEKRISQLEDSLSWKITAPLRRAKKVFTRD